MGRRTALADRLADGLRRDWGDAEAARLLPGCAPETVARLLPGLFHAVTGWKTLANRHPRTVLDAAEQALATLPEALRAPWWSRYAPAVAATVTAEPLRARALLERLGPKRCHPDSASTWATSRWPPPGGSCVSCSLPPGTPSADTAGWVPVSCARWPASS